MNEIIEHRAGESLIGNRVSGKCFIETVGKFRNRLLFIQRTMNSSLIDACHRHPSQLWNHRCLCLPSMSTPKTKDICWRNITTSRWPCHQCSPKPVVKRKQNKCSLWNRHVNVNAYRQNEESCHLDAAMHCRKINQENWWVSILICQQIDGFFLRISRHFHLNNPAISCPRRGMDGRMESTTLCHQRFDIDSLWNYWIFFFPIEQSAE